ncbi:MAG: tetratricopeptide repeat-containing sulfotransferase family protein [Gammaproteobacteria bacterium]
MSVPELSGTAQQAAAALRRNDARGALALAVAACEAQPAAYENHQLAGIAALSLGENTQAQEHFAQACRLAPDIYTGAASWTGLGEALLSLGERRKAHNAFQRALSLFPDLVSAQAGLAECLRLDGKAGAALELVRKVLAVTPADANALVTHGMVLTDREEYAAAEQTLKEALRVKPDHGPARLGLARLARFLGREEEAGNTINEVLGENPDFSAYLGLVASRRFTADDPLIARLEQRREDLKTASAHMREDILFALAKVYDDTADYARASECLREANKLHHAEGAYDISADETLARNIARFFTPELMHRYGTSERHDIPVICIASLPRSGSTLMEQMLASHSQINGGGELTHLREIVGHLNRRWGEHPQFPDIPAEDIRRDLRDAAERYAQATARLRLITPWSTDKNMMNFLYVGLLRMLLPNSRIIHMRRHPLATALGLYRQLFVNGMTYSYDLDDIVRYYKAYAKLMQHWRATLPEGFVEVFHETLVEYPEHELRRVLDYIGLEFEPACLEFYKLQRAVSTASTTQVRQPLDRRGIERHAHYQNLLAPVAAGLAEEIAAYENELNAANRSASTG